MSDLVPGLITYVVVPGFMTIMLLTGAVIAVRAEPDHRISTSAGVGIGFMTFIIYFLMSGEMGASHKAGLTSMSWAWLPITTGLVAGFMVLWAVQKRSDSALAYRDSSLPSPATPPGSPHRDTGRSVSIGGPDRNAAAPNGGSQPAISSNDRRARTAAIAPANLPPRVWA